MISKVQLRRHLLTSSSSSKNLVLLTLQLVGLLEAVTSANINCSHTQYYVPDAEGNSVVSNDSHPSGSCYNCSDNITNCMECIYNSSQPMLLCINCSKDFTLESDRCYPLPFPKWAIALIVLLGILAFGGAVIGFYVARRKPKERSNLPDPNESIKRTDDQSHPTSGYVADPTSSKKGRKMIPATEYGEVDLQNREPEDHIYQNKAFGDDEPPQTVPENYRYNQHQTRQEPPPEDTSSSSIYANVSSNSGIETVQKRNDQKPIIPSMKLSIRPKDAKQQSRDDYNYDDNDDMYVNY